MTSIQFGQIQYGEELAIQLNSTPTTVQNDIISKMQFWLQCVNAVLPNRPIPFRFTDYGNPTFSRDDFGDLLEYFMTYHRKSMIESGRFMVSDQLSRNEFVQITKTNTLQLQLAHLAINESLSEIQMQNINSELTQFNQVQIMIASTKWYYENYDQVLEDLRNASRNCCTRSAEYNQNVYYSEGLLFFLLIIAFICSVVTKTNDDPNSIDNDKYLKGLSIGFIIVEMLIVIALVVLEKYKKNALWITGADMLLLLFSIIYVVTYSANEYLKCDQMPSSSYAESQACRDILSSDKGWVYGAFICAGILALIWQILFWILIAINCCKKTC